MPGATWLEKVGAPDKVLTVMGPVSDLLIVSRPEVKGGKIAKMFMLTSELGASGANVFVYKVRTSAKALIKSFRETKSDLLVMGAYSRSRLRQRIFGGVTDFVLNRANIPVFMLHS